MQGTETKMLLVYVGSVKDLISKNRNITMKEG